MAAQFENGTTKSGEVLYDRFLFYIRFFLMSTKLTLGYNLPILTTM